MRSSCAIKSELSGCIKVYRLRLKAPESQTVVERPRQACRQIEARCRANLSRQKFWVGDDWII